MGKKNPTLNQLLKLDSFHLFDFNYGISGSWKEELEYYLIERFWDMEINEGLTIDGFKRKWKATLIEIMPYYIRLKATVIENYDPLSEFSFTETKTKKNLGSQKSANTGQDSHSAADQATDYPDTGDILADIPSRSASSSSNISYGLINTRTDDLTETLTRTIQGSQYKTKVALLMEYRVSLIRINAEIAGELKHLFKLHY